MCRNYKEDSLLKFDRKDLQAERTASTPGTSLVWLCEEQDNSKESCVWRAVNKLGNSNTGGGGR